MKCDQDSRLNLWFDLKKLLWQYELNPRVRCAFGNVYIFYSVASEYDITRKNSDLKQTSRMIFHWIDQLYIVASAEKLSAYD